LKSQAAGFFAKQEAGKAKMSVASTVEESQFMGNNKQCIKKTSLCQKYALLNYCE